MDSKNAKRCPHYQIYAESLEMEGPPSYLAIRRCLLTERMIRLLRQSGEGNRLADKLVVNVTNGHAFAFVGPDLEAVTQSACTIVRCETRCTPAYSQHLTQFGVSDPHEDEVTCEDGPPDSGQSMKDVSSAAYA